MEDSRKAWLRKHFPSGPFIAVAALIGSALAGIAVYVGAYDIGADAPHTKPVYWLIEQLRDRSIAVRSRDVNVPANLMDVKRLQSGAGLYISHRVWKSLKSAKAFIRRLQSFSGSRKDRQRNNSGSSSTELS